MIIILAFWLRAECEPDDYTALPPTDLVFSALSATYLARHNAPLNASGLRVKASGDRADDIPWGGFSESVRKQVLYNLFCTGYSYVLN